MIELGRSTWEGIYGYQVSTVDEKNQGMLNEITLRQMTRKNT